MDWPYKEIFKDGFPAEGFACREDHEKNLMKDQGKITRLLGVADSRRVRPSFPYRSHPRVSSPFTGKGAGFESYVPNKRILLFEAAVNGLGVERALRAATLDAARILGIADRVGSLEPGKDADLVLYDGDPFEYTSHVEAVVVDGEVAYRREKK